MSELGDLDNPHVWLVHDPTGEHHGGLPTYYWGIEGQEGGAPPGLATRRGLSELADPRRRHRRPHPARRSRATLIGEVKMMKERRRFERGDVVRADFPTDDIPPRQTWYRAVVLGPSTQRKGDYIVQVIEAHPDSGVQVGARLSPITGVSGWDLTPG
jgi:hypothetical protein